MPLPVKSSADVSATASDSPAYIRVRNLASTIQGIPDAWGRTAAAQPIVVSAEVSLVGHFEASARGDAVDADTVHYGTLSKVVLATLRDINDGYARDPDSSQCNTIRSVLERVLVALVGYDLTGTRGEEEGGDGGLARKTLLDAKAVRALRLTGTLPKASLLGEGISVSIGLALGPQPDPAQPSDAGRVFSSIAFSIQKLRVPTLIGVNAHERTARQVVVASIGVDKLDAPAFDFSQLESIVVKHMEESSYETLEALANELAAHMTKHLTKRYFAADYSDGWNVTLDLEKPTAVANAEAACVGIRFNTRQYSGDES